MKGDGQKTNKASEFLYRLSLDQDFQEDIEFLRKRFEITPVPIKVLHSENRPNWITQENSTEWFVAILEIMKKYSIPQPFYVPLTEFIETNDPDATYTSRLDHVGFIDRYAYRKEMGSVIDNEKFFIDRGVPFVKIILFGNNSKTDVKNFIDSKWKEIEKILEEQGDEYKKVRPKIKNKELDKAIVELARKIKKEGRGSFKGYSYILVQRELRELGFGEIDDGYIRKTLGIFNPKKKSK